MKTTEIEIAPADEHIHVSIRCSAQGIDLSNAAREERMASFEAREIRRAVAQAIYEAFAVFGGR